VLINQLPLVTLFLDQLSESLKSISPNAKLTRCQKSGLSIILIGIIITESLNWAAFGRRSLNQAKPSRLRWIFYCSKISWQKLLQASIKNIIKHYSITHGTIAFDDSDKKRCKKTTCIDGAHKVKDKATGGYFNGQELVFMILVTDLVTFPIGFQFYVPDPALSAWRKENKKLKGQGVAKKDRPEQPKPDGVNYPKKQDIALSLLQEFVDDFPDIKIKAVLADALYGTQDFMDNAALITDRCQVISQLKSNQIVSSKNSTTSLSRYFSRQSGVKCKLGIRGGKIQTVTMLAARLHVKAHGKRRYIVALKYENEEEYRYLVASDLSWRFIDIARMYTLRWLVEVFIQDWKAHCGWNKLSKQQGAEGSERGMIVSLLCEHLLLLHPEQSIRLKNKQPGLPVGCLIDRLKVESLLNTIKDVVDSVDPNKAMHELTIGLSECLMSRNSSRHMAGRDLGRQEATESLKYHAEAA
jgi:hypothetical protein